MKAPSSPRSNRERTEVTRQALISAARRLFVKKGYGGTSTPEITAAAGVTRGALYHHFEDKRDLFRAVLQEEAAAVAAEIETAAPVGLPAREALLAGSNAYLDAMTVPGRTRLLLIEGPAALGGGEMAALDEAHAARTLRKGLEAAMAIGGETSSMPIVALATLLSATFDRAALAIDAGADPVAFRSAMTGIVERTLGQSGFNFLGPERNESPGRRRPVPRSL